MDLLRCPSKILPIGNPKNRLGIQCRKYKDILNKTETFSIIKSNSQVTKCFSSKCDFSNRFITKCKTNFDCKILLIICRDNCSDFVSPQFDKFDCNCVLKTFPIIWNWEREKGDREKEEMPIIIALSLAWNVIKSNSSKHV